MSGEAFFEDYVIGKSRHSMGRTITEADLILHAGQTGDFNPHHMDAEWCRTQPFGQRIAHGTLVFSIGVGMSVGPVNPHAMTYGFDRLRFIKPVFLNDTVHAHVKITGKRDHAKRQDYGVVVESLEVTNQNGDTVLMTDHLLMVKRRKPSASAE